MFWDSYSMELTLRRVALQTTVLILETKRQGPGQSHRELEPSRGPPAKAMFQVLGRSFRATSKAQVANTRPAGPIQPSTLFHLASTVFLPGGSTELSLNI